MMTEHQLDLLPDYMELQKHIVRCLTALCTEYADFQGVRKSAEVLQELAMTFQDELKDVIPDTAPEHRKILRLWEDLEAAAIKVQKASK